MPDNKRTRIISLEGGPAVGKTTLAKNLQKLLPDIYFNYEDPAIAINKARELNLDKNKEADFVANQKIFITETIKRCQNLPVGTVILDLSPEETEFHTFSWPKFINQDWDMEKNLKSELAQLRQYRSELILYLDCSPEILRQRKTADQTRNRGSFDQYLSGLHQLRKEWFNHLNHVTIKRVDNMTEIQLVDWAINWLRERQVIS